MRPATSPPAQGPTTRREPGRAAQWCAFLAPLALLVPLALAGGGFDLESRHVAGVAAWLVVIAMLASGLASGVTPGRPALLAFGLVLALAALSLVSSLWSGSVERSFAETGRVLTYAGFLIAAFLIAQTDKLRQRFAEGLIAGLLVIAILALVSRLLPDLIFFADPSGGTRLRYPLGYWNAVGVMMGIGVALLLWLRRQGSSQAVRTVAAAAIPVFLLTLYFTYSRGGLLATVVAVGVFVALSEERLRHLATFILGLLATAPAVFVVLELRDVADGPAEGTPGQGLAVLAMLAAGTVVMFAALALGRRLATRRPTLVERTERLSREPRLLRAISAGVVVIVAVGAIALAGPVWERFSTEEIEFPDRPEEQFGQLGGAGRSEFWRVAIDSFAENPLTGTGAGTYFFTWREKREIDLAVQDAHSHYLEAFSELGLPGGLLALATMLALIAIAIGTWGRELRAARERAAALVAAMVAFAVGTGIDWLWEIAVVGAVFFLAAGLLLAARSSLAPSQADRRLVERRYPLALGGIAIGWISIAILVGPLLMQVELNRSQSAAARGDIEAAADHAHNARSLQPWAASPYLQLGGLAELEGNPEIAFDHYHHAVERESDNWQLWYLGAEAAAASGDDGTAERYLERAEELNPLAPEFEDDD